MAAYQILEATCKLLDRGGLDRKSKLETAGRLTNVQEYYIIFIYSYG